MHSFVKFYVHDDGSQTLGSTIKFYAHGDGSHTVSFMQFHAHGDGSHTVSFMHAVPCTWLWFSYCEFHACSSMHMAMVLILWGVLCAQTKNKNYVGS